MELRKDEIRKRLERKLNETEARIENWKTVTRKHKKDGGDFANVWKNFENVHEGHVYSDSVEVKIYGSYPDYSFSSDYFILKNENLTADGIEQGIKDRIEYLKAYKETIRDNLGVLDNLYDETIEELLVIKSRIKDIAGNRTPLYYDMMEVIEKHYYPITLD